MNSKSGKWILMGIFGVAIMVSAAGWTMEHGPMGHTPARMVAHMADRLDLSPQQEEQVESILTSSRQSSTADHQRLRELRRDMKEQARDFDSGEAQQIADEIGLITARVVYQMTSTHAKIYQALDEDQRAQMQEFMDRREDHRNRWRKGSWDESR